METEVVERITEDDFREALGKMVIVEMKNHKWFVGVMHYDGPDPVSTKIFLLVRGGKTRAMRLKPQEITKIEILETVKRIEVK